MKKESLTLANITQDLGRVAVCNLSNAAEWRLAFIVPLTLIGIILGFLLDSLWIALLPLAVAAYHTVRYVAAYRDYRTQKSIISDRLARGEISISTEHLSHIAPETVYEPHTHLRRAHTTKTVTFFHFVGGGSWRVPDIDRHFSWSREYHLSTQGLENISLQGDAFFYVSLQGYPNVSYLYPCKFFTLDSDLTSKAKQ